ncbi:SGNH/GDSL hydrolase family protein [Stackebrandtia nassauensis]|uniref:Lipolytic protein G-D-S-L family n=1 Tax=Stackebrandtia nassauensis (strain DSM 44728 / CIP 108903 / NRRL B-16338 / NBRC 102104 / LLR-40K-21) TaxID=446470 RepID=D3Q3C1_STANL|nr:SGNH/GDSL hydrolase family protein [Stackebrandtia nassauensis]ADD41962.1 lipolytic protein G-D-S-L family [Stackebrandtia nassauensis DSM 44728]
MTPWKKRLAATIVAATFATGSLALFTGPAQAERHEADRGWSGAWTTSQQKPGANFKPNWSKDGFADHTVRQVVRPTDSGDKARVTLSNLYGDRPLRVTAATVASSGDGAAVDADSLRALTFDGGKSAAVPAGEELTSDAVRFEVSALESVTVTLYFAEATGPATFHDESLATSYRAAGDHAGDADGAAFTETDDSWYYLSDLEVVADKKKDGVITLGDSITDGVDSTVDADNRYPDQLAERLADSGDPRAVLNAGISGNRVVTDSDNFGDHATARFDRDVLDKKGIGTLIMAEGINDIGFPERDEPVFQPNPEVTAEQIIAEYSAIIDSAHKAGLRVIGGTLSPMKGHAHYSERGEAVRDAVNEWIRESGEFDAVADFDKAVRSATDEDVFDPAYDSGDHLHPSDAGYQAMAEAVDLEDL